jgi:ATP-binding cassette, subfamily B (MDR/TAP), member 1
MEPIVQDALNKVMISRTTIIVAHRLSTIKGEDMIAVIKMARLLRRENIVPNGHRAVHMHQW